MKNDKMKQFLLEKGERVGLIAAAAIALLLIVFTLFLPGKGLTSGSASANAESLKKLTADLNSKQTSAVPGEQHKPQALKPIEAFANRQVDVDEYPTLAGFYPIPKRDLKRLQPNILKPDEFQTAFVRAQLPALQFMGFTERDGKRFPSLLLVMEGTSGGAGMAGAMGGMMPGGLQGLGNLSNRFGGIGGPGGPGGSGPGGSRPPGGGGGDGGGEEGGGGFSNPLQTYMRTRGGAGQGAKLKTIKLEDAEKGNVIPATKALPVRMAVIAASFPYRQQIDEFMTKLKLDTVGQVLSERVRGDKDEIYSSFQFRRVEVERKTINEDGSETNWETVDIKGTYNPIVIITGKQFEPEDPKLQPVLMASRGMVLGVPRQFPTGPKLPDLVANLKNIQATLKKLEAAEKKPEQPPSKLIDDFDPFNVGAQTAQRSGMMPGSGPLVPGSGPGAMMPGGGDGAAGESGGYGAIMGAPQYQSIKDTLIDHCLLRIVDLTLKPGKRYKYRLRVVMVNPNYSPKPEERKDTYPSFAKEKDLFSDWAEVPQIVEVPADQEFYVVDQKDVTNKDAGPRYVPNFRANPGDSFPTNSNQVALQVHRWLEDYSPTDNSTETRAIGEWIVAPRLVVERGEYVYRKDFKTEVPVKVTDSQNFKLDVNRSARLEQDRNLMPVPIGDRTVLVDFEGGKVQYQKAIPKKTEDDEEQIQKTRIDDVAALEVLLVRPDGRLVARTNAVDETLPERVTRYDAYRKRIDEVKGEGKPATTNPFGGTSPIP